jgi:hypothetical protein
MIVYVDRWLAESYKNAGAQALWYGQHCVEMEMSLELWNSLIPTEEAPF